MLRGELSDWVALSLLPGPGPILLHRALRRFPDPGEIAYRLSPAGWQSLSRVRQSMVDAILEARRDLRRRAEGEMRRCEKLGLRLVTVRDPAYPAALQTLPDAPILLYLRGEIQDPVVRIALVGSRRATAYGRRVATGLASGLASRGVEIVSGGARGIDSFAHRGALEAGGRTVVVLGAAFDRPYPQENEALFREAAERGGVVSEFPLGTAPKPENFPRRNRIISGLSAAVVVVEATIRSGSLITASHALDQGREVLAVPGPVSSEQSEGCHRLVQEGAKLVQRVDDILDELSPMYASALVPPPPPTAGAVASREGIGRDELAVLDLLEHDPEPVHLDLLADRAPFGVARLQTALFGLEVRGLVEQLPGRYYLSRPRRPGSG